MAVSAETGDFNKPADSEQNPNTAENNNKNKLPESWFQRLLQALCGRHCASWTRPEKHLRFLLVLAILGLGVVLLHFQPLSTAVTVFAWAAACFATGLFIGFLFGLPKTSESESEPEQPAPESSEQTSANRVQKSETQEAKEWAYKQQTNTNLQNISDWLTKIIVGVSLVELHNIGGMFSRLATSLGNELSRDEGIRTVKEFAINPAIHPGVQSTIQVAETNMGQHTMFAGALIVFFSVAGFFFGYLGTRNILAATFAKSAQMARTFGLQPLKKKVNEVSKNVEQIMYEHGEVDALILSALRTVDRYRALIEHLAGHPEDEKRRGQAERLWKFAVGTATQAFHKNPRYVPSLLALANCHYYKGDYPAAIHWAKEALKITDHNDHVRTRYNLGCYLIKYSSQLAEPEKSEFQRQAFEYLQFVTDEEPSYKEIIVYDDDWDNVREDERFKKIVGLKQTSSNKEAGLV